MEKIERLLRPREVRERVGMGDTWIRALEKRSVFPRSIYIGTGKVKRRAYRESEIDAWIAERLAERDQQEEAA
jgi:predicted DNA-binding transcriptional regulator AlpA